MITYTATNTKTGRFYIGSAKNYCNYMNRVGNHHVGNPYSDFRKELQKNPLDFVWDYSEDNFSDRDFEEALLEVYVGSKWCYNISTSTGGFNSEMAKRANAQIKDRSRSLKTRQKMSASASRPEANPPHKKEAQRKCGKALQATKSPCPQCGMMLAPGNMVKHLKGTRCKGNWGKTLHS
jgi:hypothetical protein